MEEALREAEVALHEKEVPVGCAFRHPTLGTIGLGHNNTMASRNSTRHAEFEAIDKILAKHGAEAIAECTLYVTVEPCIMCASALRQLGVRRVVFGAANDKFGGCGEHRRLCLCFHANPGLFSLDANDDTSALRTAQAPCSPSMQTSCPRCRRCHRVVEFERTRQLGCCASFTLKRIRARQCRRSARAAKWS